VCAFFIKAAWSLTAHPCVAAGISPTSFSAHHTTIHDSLKGRLSSSTGPLCHALSAEFHSTLGYHGDAGEIELMDFVRDAMFESVVRQLFGARNVPTGKVSYEVTHLLLECLVSPAPSCNIESMIRRSSRNYCP
jgi:hypothetical protein